MLLLFYPFIFLQIRNGKNGYAVVEAKYVFNDATAYVERRAVISKVPTLKKSLVWKTVSSANDIKITQHGLNVLTSTGVYFKKQGLHHQKYSFCDEYSAGFFMPVLEVKVVIKFKMSQKTFLFNESAEKR